jgi:O-antigen ligase
VYARYFPEALIYVMAVLVVVHVLMEQRKLPYNPLNFPFVLFLVVLAASTVLNLVPISVAVLGSRQILRYIVLFFTVTYLAPPKTRIRQTILILIGVAAFESALGIIQALAAGSIDQFLIPSDRKFFESIQLTAGVQQFWAPGQRVFATLGRYDQLGTFLAFFMLIAAGILYEVKKPEVQRNILLFAGLAIPALALTYSRSSWFGFVLGFLIIGLALKRDKRVALVISLAIAALLITFFYQRVVLSYLIDVPQQTITERFFEAFSSERLKGEYYGLGRLYWIVNTPLVVVRSSPFLGVGPGMFGGGAAAALHNTAAYNRLGLPFGVYGTDGQIDSNWNSLWGETGTIGLAFYLAMIYMLLRTAYRLFKKSDDPWTRGIALGYFGAVFAVCFQAMLGSYLEVRTLALFFWLMGAFVVILAKREEITV